MYFIQGKCTSGEEPCSKPWLYKPIQLWCSLRRNLCKLIRNGNMLLIHVGTHVFMIKTVFHRICESRVGIHKKVVTVLINFTKIYDLQRFNECWRLFGCSFSTFLSFQHALVSSLVYVYFSLLKPTHFICISFRFYTQ